MKKGKYKTKFGDILVAYRTEAGLTQRELSALSGIRQATINMYENNDRLPKYDQIIKLAKVLKINPGDLFPTPKGEK